MKKKILALLLVATMACGVCACGSKPVEQNNSKETLQEEVVDSKEEKQKVDMAVVCGEWRENAEAEPFIIINEDYSCVYLGEDCTWEVKHYDETVVPAYSIEITKEDGEKENIEIYQKSDGDREYWWLEGKGLLCSKISCVEINTDNFFDYFENYDGENWLKDGFGDTQSFEMVYCIRLKEKYQNILVENESKVALEVVPKYETYHFTIDIENDVCKKEVIENTEVTKENATYSFSQTGFNNDESFFGVVATILPIYEENSDKNYMSSYDIVRVAGTLAFRE